MQPRFSANLAKLHRCLLASLNVSCCATISWQCDISTLGPAGPAAIVETRISSELMSACPVSIRAAFAARSACGTASHVQLSGRDQVSISHATSNHIQLFLQAIPTFTSYRIGLGGALYGRNNTHMEQWLYRAKALIGRSIRPRMSEDAIQCRFLNQKRPNVQDSALLTSDPVPFCRVGHDWQHCLRRCLELAPAPHECIPLYQVGRFT